MVLDRWSSVRSSATIASLPDDVFVLHIGVTQLGRDRIICRKHFHPKMAITMMFAGKFNMSEAQIWDLHHCKLANVALSTDLGAV